MGLFKLRKKTKGEHPASNAEAMESTSSFGSISCMPPPQPQRSVEGERRWLGGYDTSAAASTSMLTAPSPALSRRPSLGSNDMPPTPPSAGVYYNKFATMSAVTLRYEQPRRAPRLPPLPPVPQVSHVTSPRPSHAARGAAGHGVLGSNPQASASRISLANVRSASRAGLNRLPSLWRKKQQRQSSTDSDQSEAFSDASMSPRRWRL